jgi:hypothetical protein
VLWFLERMAAAEHGYPAAGRDRSGFGRHLLRYRPRSLDLGLSRSRSGRLVGDNIGFWLGRKLGYLLVLRYGRYIGMPDARIKLGRYVFLRHGGKVVFLGRFVAYLRVLAAVLAGINHMDWGRFLLANAAGGFLWAGVFGWGAYWFDKALLHVPVPIALGLLIVTITFGMVRDVLAWARTGAAGCGGKSISRSLAATLNLANACALERATTAGLPLLLRRYSFRPSRRPSAVAAEGVPK